MRKYIMLTGILFICASLLIACSDNKQEQVESVGTNENTEVEDSDQEVEKEDTNDTDDESVAKDEDQEIAGKVIVDKEQNLLKVEVETNLLENTQVDAMLRKAYGEIDVHTSQLGWETAEVGSDGNVSFDYPLGDDFFEKFHGEDFEFMISFASSQVYDHLVDAYGEEGEEFSGPFAYQFSSNSLQGKQLLVPIYLRVGDDQTEYVIETPERKEVPDDYGDTEVWVDVEVVDNDHRFIYLEGETNLLEGTMIEGKYYSDEEATFYDGFITEKHVEPDGTFLLPIKYDSITQDGYIEIKSAPMRDHRTEEDIYDTYGDDFENLSGDVVKEVDDHQEVLLTIDTKGKGIDNPEDSFVTEDDGEYKIQVPDDVLFDFDKSNLKTEAKDTLKDVIDILEDLNDGTAIEINGHTDNEGETDYNLGLSEERADEVEKYLSKNGSIDHLSIDINGYGETDPIESNETEEGRERNRRVEIVIENLD